ncbi:MAG TPA: glycosyltransferase family 4 protein [Flavipsychrobacter sp.]|nr:glycosyltransferase family 4 protein [Flavipsychrobacter sp.]
MKVAFISRATLYSSPGGDTKQLEETAAGLRSMGVTVDVYLTNQPIDYTQYDLLHFFNIIRPADVIAHMKRSGKPCLVSTIFVEYGTVKEEGRGGIVGTIKKLIPESTFEYIKTVARAVKNGEKIVSKEYLLWGHTKSTMYVARHAKMLLPNSESEYRRFVAKYPVTTPYHVVPNGINTKNLENKYPENADYKNAIICMGRIESRKNQLNLIRALNNTQYKLYIHGKPSPNNMAYFEQCKQEAAANIHIGGHLDEEMLYTAYSNAKVHVLPSYFETTGLSSLEAAVMGCNIVVTDKGDTRDYFLNDAWYCEPDDVASIKDAIDRAFNAPYSQEFKKRILDSFTWKRAAEETYKAYANVLKL